MALVLMDQCMASYDSPPEVIVLDVDDTEDRAHGAQEHIRYDGYDGGSCCMPGHLYAGLAGRLSTTILKAKRFSGAQRLAVRKRVVKRLQHAWPDTWVLVRGDSHCASPEGMAWMEAPPPLRYVIGLTSNAVWHKLARGHRASQAGLGVLGAQGSPLSLDALPGGHMVALAPCGHQGRGVRTRRQHALCRDG